MRSCASITTRVLPVALALAMVLCGCATSNTKTNRDAQYAGHPKRLFVVETLVALGDGFEDDFEPLLTHDIQACGGEVAYHRVEASDATNPLSLDGPGAAQQAATKAIFTQITAYAPDAVLFMRISYRSLLNGMLNGVTINSKVFDYKTQKPVWAGVSSFGFAPASSNATRAKVLHDDLAPKLRHDGLIPDCPAAAALPNAR